MAQWIRRLPTQQEIPGSSPGMGFFFKTSATTLRICFLILFCYDFLCSLVGQDITHTKQAGKIKAFEPIICLVLFFSNLLSLQLFSKKFESSSPRIEPDSHRMNSLLFIVPVRESQFFLKKKSSTHTDPGSVRSSGNRLGRSNGGKMKIVTIFFIP